VPHTLDILFLTNFSDYCFRSIPAVAQMADSLNVRLTILHSYDANVTDRRAAELQLQSFFPEADRYANCQRLAVPGPLIKAVDRHLQVFPVNLLVVPATDAIGFPRIGERSLRAHLMEMSGVPVWTIGRKIHWGKLLQPVRNVACWVDFSAPDTNHVAFAIDYASKLNANLHLLRAIPEVTEGSLIAALHNRALHPVDAAEEIMRLCENAPIEPRIHIGRGGGPRARARMLRDCDANIVFMRSEESVLGRRFGWGFGDRLPCPAVYVGKELSVPVWNLQTHGIARGLRATAQGWVSELGLA
jgi:hypothetical protein